MAYLGSWNINDYIGIPAACHRFSTGAAYAPTSLTYSIYEDATVAPGIDEDVDMVPGTPFDAIVGCYLVRRQLTAAAGFEAGKNYTVVVKATVDSVAAIQMHTFQIRAASDAVAISGNTTAADNVEANIGNLDAAISTRSTVTTAQVNTEVDTALTDIHLDHLLAATYDPASKPGAADALLNELVENDGGVSRFTANALEQGPGGGSNPVLLQSTTIATLATQTSFTLTAGSGDDDAYLDQLAVFTDQSVGTQKSVRLISGYTGATKTVTLESAPDFTIAVGDTIEIVAIPTVFDVDADTVTLKSGTHTGAVIPTVSALTGHTPQTGDSYARIGAPAGASVSADIAALNNLSAAEVNAQVLDVLNVDTIAAVTTDPGATPTVLEILRLVYQALRNKVTATATEAALYNDAGSAEAFTKAISDDETTFTSGTLTVAS